MYAVDSMRMEKGYGHWKVGFVTELNRCAAGLVRFVDLSKDFPGRPRLEAQNAAGNRRQRVVSALCSLDPDNTFPRGDAT